MPQRLDQIKVKVRTRTGYARVAVRLMALLMRFHRVPGAVALVRLFSRIVMVGYRIDSGGPRLRTRWRYYRLPIEFKYVRR
jgi:hypothetical protein